jgi:integrase
VKYVFKNQSGYKFCRKIPNSDKQFVFSLKTKNAKIAKKISSLFLIKSFSYFLLLQNLTREEIVIRFPEIEDALKVYKHEALKEYSTLEKQRHEHLSFENKDGAHPDSIKHWSEEFHGHVCGQKTERQTHELGKKILARASQHLKVFYQTITDEERTIFFQLLLKNETKILKQDLKRAKEYFDLDYQLEEDKSNKFEQIVQQLMLNNVLSGSMGNKDQSDSMEVVTIKTNEEMLAEFCKTPDVKAKTKHELQKVHSSIEVLFQSSDKVSLVDYDMEDFKEFWNALLYTPKGVASYPDVFNDYEKNYFEIAKSFENEEIQVEYPERVFEFQAIRTLAEKLAIVRKFLRFCVKKHYLEKSLLEDEDFDPRHFAIKATASLKRLPYHNSELRGMFARFKEKNFFIKNIANFYLPMIALFAGLRMEEIAQMTAKHIINEEGIICFNIHGRLKTKESKRKVPIHEFLINELRFLEYVESRKDEAMLFDMRAVVINGKVKYSHKYVEAFSEFRKTFVEPVRIEDDLITFHSFRHTFATFAARGKVQKHDITDLLGHKQPKDDQTLGYIHADIKDKYGFIHDMNISEIKDDLMKMAFDFRQVSKELF